MMRPALALAALGALAATAAAQKLPSPDDPKPVPARVTVCPTGMTKCPANKQICFQVPIISQDPRAPGAVGGGPALQWILDEIARNRQKNTTIELCAGVYRNAESKKRVLQVLHDECGKRNYTTSFLISGIDDLTLRAAGKTAAEDIILLGDHEHALTVHRSHRVRIGGVTLAAMGGTKSNGIGDSSLNVQDSTGLLANSIVTYHWNGASNPALSDPLLSPVARHVLDQEGIQLAGSDTYFEIYNNIIARNLHNGIILIDGARAFVVRNLIYRNGHFGHFLANHSGQGINTFHDRGEENYCRDVKKAYYAPESALKAWNNVIEDNTGHGVILRSTWQKRGVPLRGASLLAAGRLSSAEVDTWSRDYQTVIARNRIRGNGRPGIRLGHWWSYRPSKTSHGNYIWLQDNAMCHIAGNDVAQNTADDPRPAGVPGKDGTTWPAGPVEAAGFMIDDIASWIHDSARVKVYNNNFHGNGQSGQVQHSYPAHVAPRVEMASSNTTLDPAAHQSELDQRQVGAFFAGNKSWAAFSRNHHPGLTSTGKKRYKDKMDRIHALLGKVDKRAHFIDSAPETEQWCRSIAACEADRPCCNDFAWCTARSLCASARKRSRARKPARARPRRLGPSEPEE